MAEEKVKLTEKELDFIAGGGAWSDFCQWVSDLFHKTTSNNKKPTPNIPLMGR